ncbi:MAG: hypothetical protein M0D55_10650 [Elusimicrobiota bacterium]|nr:MAG: hypothetical protein M0D55_10650 [Elusimicrobiota bacterium]
MPSQSSTISAKRLDGERDQIDRVRPVQAPVPDLLGAARRMLEQDSVGDGAEARGHGRAHLGGGLLSGRVVAREPAPRVLGLGLRPHLDRVFDEMEARRRIHDRITDLDLVFPPFVENAGLDDQLALPVGETDGASVE